ncbi:hypothetical protein ESCAB7627_0123 [Escherichia albertii TW07627]|uniref:Uncharacterized protein n=1 Tax=Escherichia albertii (strain TW07627) TaxID=502347 RepID=A0ABC9NQ38_ESCAT|nr:hypothetical protein ESCAB7627_0123 [Escherichia albertii TW07627]
MLCNAIPGLVSGFKFHSFMVTSTEAEIVGLDAEVLNVSFFWIQ